MVLNLSSWFQQVGHQVEVVNIYRDTTLLPQFEQASIRVHNLRLTPYLSQWYPVALVRYLRHFHPDVVHCHDTAWRKTVRACQLAGIPCVWTMHGYLQDWVKAGARWMRQCARDTAFLVGVEMTVRDLILREVCADEHKVLYVPNGVPDLYNEHLSPVHWGAPIPADAVLMGMVSRLEPPKDPFTLVEAFALVKQKVEQAHLLFVGEGSLSEEVRRFAIERDLAQSVHLLGRRTDVAAILHYLHVFVLSSGSEGQSLAILEAMSAQRPIVATDVGGNSILLDGGRCGILVPPRDPHALAEAILELLTNREKAQQLARNARQRFLEHFTIDAMGKRYLEIYERAIAQHRGKT
ncbi:MAG: hypothetical protein KatS3mg022_3234 [Armatimonadota bacterium]|nr:MAG: hypothetical protein KatS3mg022_3234 [Armatimonadota bacterium]